MTDKSLRALIEENDDQCLFVPCVYDCASARAVEIAGFKAMLLSGGEMSIAMNGIVDYGITNLNDVEWMISRISASSMIPLAADIDNGYGGSPIAVYRTCKRLVAAGAKALQMEDAGEDYLLPVSREKFYAKVRAAVEALKGTDCMLIARTNVSIKDDPQEACERMRMAHELGADMTMVVTIRTMEEAQLVAANVPGWKAFPDVKVTKDGRTEATAAKLREMDYRIMTSHWLLKAAMDAMLEHSFKNFENQDVTYTWNKPGPTGLGGFNAMPYFDPASYMAFEENFTGVSKVHPIMQLFNDDYPADWPRPDAGKRF